MFLEKFHDSADNFLMFIQCLSENEDVIQIDHHYTFGNEVLKDPIHHSLEGSWTIGQAKEHEKWFIEALVGPESSFPFVAFLHPDIIKTPMDIELSKVPGPLQLVDELGDKG